MIYIIKNTTNNIVLELSGLTNETNPYYLFEFIDENNVDKPKRYFTTPNISTSIDRYDEFVMIESDNGSDTNADDSSINWNNGQYKYNIYISLSVIDIDDVVSIITNKPISTGRMVVNGIDETVDVIYDSNITDATTESVYD